MKNKKILKIIDECVWWFIYLLPLFAWLAVLATDNITLSSVMGNFGINTTNIVYTSLYALFGSTLPILGSNSAVLLYATYFVLMNLVHLAIDFLVFIPRLAHNFMEGLYDCDFEE